MAAPRENSQAAAPVPLPPLPPPSPPPLPQLLPMDQLPRRLEHEISNMDSLIRKLEDEYSQHVASQGNESWIITRKIQKVKAMRETVISRYLQHQQQQDDGGNDGGDAPPPPSAAGGAAEEGN